MNYTTIPSREIIEKTAQALRARGVEAILVKSSAEALAKIKELIEKLGF